VGRRSRPLLLYKAAHFAKRFPGMVIPEYLCTILQFFVDGQQKRQAHKFPMTAIEF
jgi:hypothetical protein